MRLVIQRVSRASVAVEEKTIASIGHGYMILIGIGHEDTKETAQKLAKKVLALRINEDENNKTNLSIKDTQGAILVVSQFTLYADCSHGNRPGFTLAANPKKAEELYEYFTDELKKEIPDVQHGSFGADMKVELLNDGPFTILLEA